MMRVVWLAHSGFLVELESCCLVFDMENDPAHVLAQLPKGKPLFVFATHAHSDHFNPAILQLPARAFLLSEDIPRRKVGARGDVEFLAPGDIVDIEGLRVEAFGSTDQGISLRVSADGLTLFHAGDLNCWYWAHESSEAELRQSLAAWRSELARLNDGTKIDLTMFPVDPRLEEYLAMGAREYVERIHPRWFIPMHYAAGNPDVAAALSEIVRPGTQVLYPTHPGWCWNGQ